MVVTIHFLMRFVADPAFLSRLLDEKIHEPVKNFSMTL